MARAKAQPKKPKWQPIENIGDSRESAREKQDKLYSDLEEFEAFREKILPAIRKDLMSGMTAAQLREKYSALVQARLITEAITTPDAAKASAAARDILDRAHGKATEKKEVTHKFADLSDQELDSILISEEEELAVIEGQLKQ